MDLEVRVPATIANLGPGFDRLGIALDVHLQVGFASASRTRVVRGGEEIDPERDLIFRAFKAAFDSVDKPAPTVTIETIGAFPVGRGLGASAAAIVAGLVAADSVGELGMNQATLAQLAIEIEGHPDNVLPALLGGLILHAGAGWLRMTPAESISPLVLVSEKQVPTEEARKVVPSEVRLEDAVANSAATAALVMALRGVEGPEVLDWAMKDRLHVPYRLEIMPETKKMLQLLEESGFAATLSGAGPSVVCLVASPVLEDSRERIQGMLLPGWSILVPSWDLKGAQTR